MQCLKSWCCTSSSSVTFRSHFPPMPSLGRCDLLRIRKLPSAHLLVHSYLGLQRSSSLHGPLSTTSPTAVSLTSLRSSSVGPGRGHTPASVYRWPHGRNMGNLGTYASADAWQHWSERGTRSISHVVCRATRIKCSHGRPFPSTRVSGQLLLSRARALGTGAINEEFFSGALLVHHEVVDTHDTTRPFSLLNRIPRVHDPAKGCKARATVNHDLRSYRSRQRGINLHQNTESAPRRWIILR
jgi:hypothetical protein